MVANTNVPWVVLVVIPKIGLFSRSSMASIRPQSG
jgi:hypothetical protein